MEVALLFGMVIGLMLIGVPIAIAPGIDPIHLGIIMVVNMEIGMITPPVGPNLFVTAGVAKMSVTGVIRAAPALGGDNVPLPDHCDPRAAGLHLAAQHADGARGDHTLAR